MSCRDRAAITAWHHGPMTADTGAVTLGVAAVSEPDPVVTGDVPDDAAQIVSAELAEHELAELGRGFPEGFDMCSMIWFVITDADVDQTPAGKASNLLVGSAQQIEDRLKRYQEAGMTMPLLWPPFRDVPTAKTLDDLKRLTEEIMPRVNAV